MRRFYWILTAYILLIVGHYTPLITGFMGISLNGHQMVACMILRILSLLTFLCVLLSWLWSLLEVALPAYVCHPIREVHYQARLCAKINSLN